MDKYYFGGFWQVRHYSAKYQIFLNLSIKQICTGKDWLVDGS